MEKAISVWTKEARNFTCSALSGDNWRRKLGMTKHTENQYIAAEGHTLVIETSGESSGTSPIIYTGESFSVQITTCRNQSASFLWCLINNSEDLVLYGNRLVNLFRTEQWLPDYNIRLGRKEGKKFIWFPPKWKNASNGNFINRFRAGNEMI